jgi:hypothetical protein
MTIRLSDWLREREGGSELRDSVEQVAIRATQALGFEVTPANLAGVASAADVPVGVPKAADLAARVAQLELAMPGVLDQIAALKDAFESFLVDQPEVEGESSRFGEQGV